MREATPADRPRGFEAQCPLCGRIFSRDSVCEMHKPYRRPVTQTCKDPAGLGFSAYERRGLVIWYQALPENASKRRTLKLLRQPRTQEATHG